MRCIKSITSIVSGLLFISISASAQPPRNQILDDVHVTEKAGCYTVQIAFTFPVRYVRHFPFEQGKDLQIHIEPIAVGKLDKQAIFDRESMKMRPSVGLPLDQVVYEGDVEGGPYLHVLFNEVVNYEVGQGTDFRSILVAIQNTDTPPDTAICPHLPKIK